MQSWHEVERGYGYGAELGEPWRYCWDEEAYLRWEAGQLVLFDEARERRAPGRQLAVGTSCTYHYY